MNQADKKAHAARIYEKAYGVGYTAGRAFGKYGIPAMITYFAVKYGVRSAVKSIIKETQ